MSVTGRAGLRRLARWSAACLLYYTGLLWLYRAAARRRLEEDGVVLCYHRVVDGATAGREDSQQGIVASADYFRRQLEHVTRAYEMVSLTAYVAGRGGLGRWPVCAVAFEDGWVDNHDVAFPLLRRYRVPAMVFVTTGFVEHGAPFWHMRLIHVLRTGDLSRLSVDGLDRRLYPDPVRRRLRDVAALGRRPTADDLDGLVEALKAYREERIEVMLAHLQDRLGGPVDSLAGRRFGLTWPQVAVMAEHGIEFGAHGVTHRILTTLTDAEVRQEAEGAKVALERRLGAPVSFFLCPNGDSDPAVRRALQAAGYRYVLPVDGEGGRLARLRRVNIHDGACTSPFGRFSRCLFALELSGLKERLLRRA